MFGMTTGEIGARMNPVRSRDNVEYILRHYRISPVAVIGGRRVFDEAGVKLIEAAMKEVETRKRQCQLRNLAAAKAAVARLGVVVASEM